MSGLFRCAGDILFDDHEPLPGQISNVQLKKYSETSNFLQLQQPLTPQHPYFFAQIRAIAEKSQITLGIAGPNIDNDAHPGHWNNTVGYHNHTGKCYTSHMDEANTDGEKFSVGDMFGVLVTYFGEDMSTVMFLKNGLPVATRYLFEPDHSNFLPTICLEHGPIDLGIMWPKGAMGIPRFDEKNMKNWIKGSSVTYDMRQNMFILNEDSPVAAIQSPQPLHKDWSHYEVIVKETTEDGESPGVGVATCSPLKPSPTCLLLRDFFRWKADGKLQKITAGQRIGFGVHYNFMERQQKNFDDKAKQLVLCYVTLDSEIVFLQMMIQPPGGFYPLVLLARGISKVTFDVETDRGIVNEALMRDLDEIYRKRMIEDMEIINSDKEENELTPAMFRISEAIITEITMTTFKAVLPASQKGIHTIQFKSPLNLDRPYFFIEINKLNEDSVLSLGIAGPEFPLNKHPGKVAPSTGWVSRDGKMYFDTRSTGNIEGEMFCEGDTVGLQIQAIQDDLSVVLFIKNNRPIGTRYVTTTDPAKLWPVVSLCGNGYDVEVEIFWQNRVSVPPMFNINRLDHWCCPKGCEIDPETNIVSVKDHQKPLVFQCHRSLDDDFNHFEIRILEEHGAAVGKPTPVIVLSSACSRGNLITNSNFMLEYIRFWAVGEAESSVKVGDLVGWGMLLPESQRDKKNPLVICYLTINRNIVLTRVMYEPPGGLYPMVLLPANVNHVEFIFSAKVIESHPITEYIVQELLDETEQILEEEKLGLADGKDVDELDIDRLRLLKPFAEVHSAVNLDNNEKTSQDLSSVVMKSSALNKVKKALKEKKESDLGRTDEHSDGRRISQSKSCVIL